MQLFAYTETMKDNYFYGWTALPRHYRLNNSIVVQVINRAASPVGIINPLIFNLCHFIKSNYTASKANR